MSTQAYLIDQITDRSIDAIRAGNDTSDSAKQEAERVALQVSEPVVAQETTPEPAPTISQQVEQQPTPIRPTRIMSLQDKAEFLKYLQLTWNGYDAALASFNKQRAA